MNENKRALGTEKEIRAANYMAQNGCRILARNFRSRFGEIDLIAREGGTIVFIEVKYRKTSRHGLPEEAVTAQKMRRISRAADYYLTSYQIPDSTSIRFDVIAIEGAGLRHHRDAFPYVPPGR